MSWIESHQSLGDHPKTIRAAAILKIDPAQMVGHLHYLWWWALDYAPDGDLSEFSPTEIAHACRWRKGPDAFVEALVTCGRNGFIDATNGTYQIHDWDLYAGRLLDKRRKDAARKRGHRADIQRTSSGQDAERPRDGARTARAIPTTPNLPTMIPTGSSNQPTTPALPRDGDAGFRQASEALTRLGARLNALVYDEIGMLLDEGTKPEWFEAAAAIAAGNGKTTWNYVKAILSGWGTDGPPKLKPVPNQPADEPKGARFDFEAYEREQAEASEKSRLRWEARRAKLGQPEAPEGAS